MEMAFPIPDHLPRANQFRQADVSTSILTALSETSPITLAQTNDWVKQLNDAINQTELAIHNRIHGDLKAFERQLEASQSIQRRYTTLTSHIAQLHTELEDAETGNIPRITRALREHSDIAQQVLDSVTIGSSLHYLQRCKRMHNNVIQLMKSGELPAAMIASTELQTLVGDCPAPLDKSLVFLDLQHVTRTSRDNVLEQLSRAYHSCLSLKDAKLSVQHRYKSLSLGDILTSIPSQTLQTDLTTLRKDFVAQFIRPVLSTEPFSLASSSTFLELRSSRSSPPLESILGGFSFLHEQFIPHLPNTQRKQFASSLYFPLCDAIEEYLLSTMPRGLSGLPSYLDHVLAALDLESKIDEMGFFGGTERRIQHWSMQVQSHYEKRRRAELLEEVRTIILTDKKPSERIEVDVPSTISGDMQSMEEPKEAKAEDEEVNWDFDDDTGPGVQKGSNGDLNREDEQKEDIEMEDGDGWGFDDDDKGNTSPTEKKNTEEEGHDPWGVEWDDAPTGKVEANPRAIMSGNQSNPSTSHTQSAARSTSSFPNSTLKKTVQEFYFVSHAATQLSTVTKQVLEEGLQLLNSNVFRDRGFPASRSTVLLSTVPSALDLFRALYPTSKSGKSKSLIEQLQYSNDCKYLAEASEGLRSTYTSAHQHRDADDLNVRFEETTQRLEMMSASWLEDVMDEEAQILLSQFAGIGGFDDLGYSSTYEEAHGIIKQIKNRITILSQELKVPLTASSYNQNLGMLIDRVLDRILQDVFALRDISEIVSERIATICRTLHPLEALFPEIGNGVSTVASYASLWLKFTYLSDILEGSLADISSWFDSGLLIDYEPEELCQLVKALFAETPHRANFISRVLNHGRA
ncbi:hypothetical protein FRC17_010600 [Serendipita sp. 399]|nr:hypothetical protein FRC17_010600 [Serendipita sp. 399]